jgi:hypothetical protein
MDKRRNKTKIAQQLFRGKEDKDSDNYPDVRVGDGKDTKDGLMN